MTVPGSVHVVHEVMESGPVGCFDDFRVTRIGYLVLGTNHRTLPAVLRPKIGLSKCPDGPPVNPEWERAESCR